MSLKWKVSGAICVVCVFGYLCCSSVFQLAATSFCFLLQTFLITCMVGKSMLRCSSRLSLRRRAAWSPQSRVLSTGSTVLHSTPEPPSPSETHQIPTRNTIVHNLKTEKEFDILVIGGGATGAGEACVLSSRTSRNLLSTIECFL